MQSGIQTPQFSSKASDYKYDIEEINNKLFEAFNQPKPKEKPLSKESVAPYNS